MKEEVLKIPFVSGVKQFVELRELMILVQDLQTGKSSTPAKLETEALVP